MVQQIEKLHTARSHSDGRDEIARWQSSQPDNYFLADGQLIAQLERLWGPDVFEANRFGLEKFGGEAATLVDVAVRKANEVENLPRLKRFSLNGTRTEEVEHC